MSEAFSLYLSMGGGWLLFGTVVFVILDLLLRVNKISLAVALIVDLIGLLLCTVNNALAAVIIMLYITGLCLIVLVLPWIWQAIRRFILKK